VGDGWFSKGSDRLVESLRKNGETSFMIFPEYQYTDRGVYHKDCPYTCKAGAIERAISLGFNQILWLDCSVQVIKPLEDFWKIIEENGYYFMTGGWNCAQECNDKSLEYFGFTRDQAELLPCLWSCIFALDLRNEKAKQVCDLFLQSAKDGIFHGSRHHDGQSNDPRFLHHRQDQSCLSLAVHKVGIDKIFFPNIHMAYTGMGAPITETTFFTVQGL
jgi:hypothetical protein